MDRPLSLSKIFHLPGAAFYVSEFITPAEEARILDKFSTRPASAFRNLSHRRLQIYPGELDPRTNVLVAGSLPEWIETPMVARLLRTPIEGAGASHVFAGSPHQRPTHVLLNEYEAGTGIAAHEDGPAYFPLVSVIHSVQILELLYPVTCAYLLLDLVAVYEA